MKKLTFFAGCLLFLFGSMLNVSHAYAQTLDNKSDMFTVGDGALLSVYGKTKNGDNAKLTVKSKGMVNLHGDLDLDDNSEFILVSTSEQNTASLIGYATTTTALNNGTGIIRSQRYITGSDDATGANPSDAKWHYFTSPVSGQAINIDWVENNRIAYWNDTDDQTLDFWRWDEPRSSWIRYNNPNFNDASITDKSNHDYHTTFESGKGYIAAVKADGRTATKGTLEFEGNTFNGPSAAAGVTVPVFSEGVDQPTQSCWNGWNLIGNPYPSAYNIKKWVENHSNELNECHQAVYLYVEQNPSQAPIQGQGDYDGVFCSVQDYKVISNNGAGYDYYYYYIDNAGNHHYLNSSFEELNANTNQYLAVGQGFFIKVKDDGATTIDFPVGNAADPSTTPIDGMKDSEDYRAHAFANATYRGREETAWPSFAILVNDKDGNATSSVVSFNEKMTTGSDPSYDVTRFENAAQSVAVYTQLVDKDSGCGDLIMQALPFIEQNNDRGNEEDILPEVGYVIPVGLDVKETMNVNFNVATDQLDDQAIILEDRKLNEFTDIKAGHYATTADKSENGYGRFYIHFGPKADPNMSSDNLQITAYMIDKHQLKILNPATVVGDYQIFDVNGNLLYDGRLDGNDEQIIQIDLAMGMYLLHVNTAAKSQAFKFINK